MNRPDFQPLRPEQALAIATIHKLLAVVARKASELEEEIDNIHQLLHDLLKKLGWTPARVPPALPVAGLGRGTVDAGLQNKARAGVASLSLITQPSGRVSMQIEGRDKFLLPARLAALMDALIMDDGSSPDHLVAWKTEEGVIIALKRITGKQYNNHDFNQLIYLLRTTLSDHHENRWLVMRDSLFGVRFALRRSPSSVTGVNHN